MKLVAVLLINLIGGCTNYSVNKYHNDNSQNYILNYSLIEKFDILEKQCELDSIVVTYYNTDNSRYYEYIVIYSVTEGLTIMGNGIAQGLIPLKISFPNYTEEFLSVIDEFYIKKKNFIIKNKIRTDDYYITDRPTFLIECYYGNKRLLCEFTKLSVEGYNLVFDEKFEKFIRMVKKMVQEYDKKIYNTDTLRQKYW